MFCVLHVWALGTLLVLHRQFVFVQETRGATGATWDQLLPVHQEQDCHGHRQLQIKR